MERNCFHGQLMQHYVYFNVKTIKTFKKQNMLKLHRLQKVLKAKITNKNKQGANVNVNFSLCSF